MTTPGEHGPRPFDPHTLATRWAHALADTSYVSMTADEITTFLTPHAAALHTALHARRPSNRAARHAGTALVDAHFTGTAALENTLRLLATALTDSPPTRLDALLASLAAAYTTALHARTLREQHVLRDAVLTARRRSATARHASETRFTAVFDDAPLGIAITTADGTILDANPALARMLGRDTADLRAHALPELFDPDDAPDIAHLHHERATGTTTRGQLERRIPRADGRTLWAYLSATAAPGPDGETHVVTVVEDITDRYLLQARLRHQAHHDALTALPNRAQFMRRLATMLADAAPTDHIGLCYLDLDHFKAVNDTLGHTAGDHVLLAISRRLDELAARHGHFLAHMGGDEFMILVANPTSPDTMTHLAEEVLRTLRQRPPESTEPPVTASIGLVEHPASDTNPADLVKDADVTLYWAKAHRNRWALFDPERKERDIDRYTLAEAMPQALRRGEFTVEYQPIVGLDGGAVVAVESLLRWHHPHRGRIRPDLFIPLAEESGFIVELGQWVLRESCRQAARWNTATDHPPLVSVNLAVHQLTDPGILHTVAATLRETALPPHLLQLELTESAVMDAESTPLRTLHALTALGVRVAIDDFGTGYSNLAYLRRLPVHALKIAGALVDGLRDPHDTVDRDIVASLITLAHALGLTVVAEGVEEQLQADRLRDIGCDSAQGWFFARPGPPETVNALLTPKPDEPS